MALRRNSNTHLTVEPQSAKTGEQSDPNVTADLDEPLVETPHEIEPNSTINKVLLSSSNEVSKTNKSRHTELFTGNLYVSDSDDTDCSIITKDSEESSKPQDLESEDLFHSSSASSLPPAAQQHRQIVNRLSQKMVNLSLIHEQNSPLVSRYLTGTTVDNELAEDVLIFTETVAPLLPVLCKNKTSAHLSGTTVSNTIQASDDMKADKRLSVVSIVSISSSSGSSTCHEDVTDNENAADSEDEEEVIVKDAISVLDSDEENGNIEQWVDEVIVPPPNRMSVTSLSSTVVNKLDSFFNNIPLVESPNSSSATQQSNTNHSVYVSETSDESVYVSEPPESGETSIEIDPNANKPAVPVITITSPAKPIATAPLQAAAKCTPHTLSKCTTPTINISATIHIKIQVPDDGSSESGESFSSKSCGEYIIESSEFGLKIVFLFFFFTTNTRCS